MLISKVVFIAYVPDTCKSIAKKFPYANSKDLLKSKCSGTAKDLQINDYDDISFEEFKGRF